MKITEYLILIGLLFLCSSCGYKIVNNLENNQFKIINSELSGNSKINRILKKNFNRLTENSEALKIFKVNTNSELIKTVTSKDSKGNDASFSIQVKVNMKIFENDKLLNLSNYEKKVNYNTSKSQFEIKQYENVLVNDLTDQIVIDINNFLGSIQ